MHPSVGTRDTGWWGGAAQRDAGVGAQQRPSAVRQRDRPLAPPYPTVAIGIPDSIFPRLSRKSFLTDSIFPSIFKALPAALRDVYLRVGGPSQWVHPSRREVWPE